MLNLTRLFECQRTLEAHILAAHPELIGVDLLPKNLLALQVELGELANELPEVFKYWSNKKNNWERALAEYVDGLHLVFSIISDFAWEDQKYVLENAAHPVDSANRGKDITHQFLKVFGLSAALIASVDLRNDIVDLFQHFLCLGEMIGFSGEQIERAFLEKNAKNHERQEAGY